MGDSSNPAETDGGSSVQPSLSTNTSNLKEDRDIQSPDSKPTVQPSALGKFVGLNQCARFYKFGLESIDEGQLNHPQEAYKEAFKRENVVEKKSGDDFEAAVVEAIKPHLRSFHDLTDATVDETAEKLESAVELIASLGPAADPVALFQPALAGRIGSWEVNGDADLIFIWPGEKSVTENQFKQPEADTATTESDHTTSTDHPDAYVRVIDVKAATEEQAHQQIQTAVYSLLIDQSLSPSIGENCAIETGVLTREADVSQPTRGEIPIFDRKSREDDVRRLLRPGGKLDTLYTQDFDEAGYQLEQKCGSCPYNEACFAESIEAASVELLGVSGGVKQQLATNGIETLHDLAALAYPPDERKPASYEELKPRDTDTYEALATEPGLGEQLPELIQQAQSMVGALNPNAEHAHSARDAPWVTRTGYGSLPDDNPPESYDLEYKRGSMIRIYLNLQVDHVHDRLVAIGGQVTATESTTEPIHISQVAESIPKTKAETMAFGEQVEQDSTIDVIEHELVDAFVDKLFDAVQQIAAGIDFSDSDVDNPPVHHYLYSDSELEALQDALDRRITAETNSSEEQAGSSTDTPTEDGQQTTLAASSTSSDQNTSTNTATTDTEATHALAFRDLLGGRAGIDGGSVSIVQNDARKRVAPKSPSVGLLPLHTQFSPWDNQDFKSPTDWTYTPTDPSRLPAGTSEIDLKEAFRYNLFDYRVPYSEREDGPGIELLMENTESDADGWYPSRVRYGAQIPLAYIWSAVGRIDDEWVEDINRDSDRAWPVDTYRYHNDDSKDTLITTEDIGALVEHFTDALAHIERALSYKDAGATKEPLDPETLPNYQLPEPSLATTAREYLALEYHTGREETLEHYGKQWPQRLRSGNSILMVIADVEEKPNEVEITGRLPYDNLPFDKPQRILNAIRKKGSSGATGGSWMVATSIDQYGNPSVEKPWQIESGVPVTIEALDVSRDHIELNARQMGAHGGSDFQVYHDRWTTDESKAESKTYFAEGQLFVLDPQSDDINSERMADALEHANQNHLCQLLEGLRRGTTPTPRTDAFPGAAVTEFAQWLQNSYGVDSFPNDEQQEFITATNRELTLLQGPPGTGKTSGAVAPAIAARTYANGEQNSRCRSLVTGPSNKAVDEVMADAAEVVEAYRNDPETGPELDNVKLVRLTGSSTSDEDDEEGGDNPAQSKLDGSTTASDDTDSSSSQPSNDESDSDEIEAVDYVTYYDDDDAQEVREIQNRLLGQQTIGDDTDAEEHIILFTTASRAWGLAGKLTNEYDADELLESGADLFDLLAIDEASMQTVPELLLAGSFYRPGGQVLIAGDHRQMPPVQRHEWREERRPTVAAVAPYLSTLDYCRLLRGDTIDSLDDETRELIHVAADNTETEIDLPLHQLEETYRCHTRVASFLKRWVYANDDIDYRSDVTATLAEPTPSTEGLKTALEIDQPITLIVHDDTHSQQSNPTEAVIARKLVEAANPADDTGIVTPHNAQRGLLERDFSSHLGEAGEHVDIDTVERYQGGERDMMIVSGTAADPDYVSAESDFLLNRNRVNVAVSRMRTKLIVIASRSVFSHIPLDLDQYREALLWKGLSQDLGVLDPDRDADWNGTVSEFTGLTTTSLPERVNGEHTTISVYGLDADGNPSTNS